MESDSESEVYSSEDQSESDTEKQIETAKETKDGHMTSKKRKQCEEDEDLEEEGEDSDADVGDSDDDDEGSDEEEDASDDAESDISNDKMSKRTKTGDDPRFQFASDKLNESGDDSHADEANNQKEQSKTLKAKESKVTSKPGIIYLSRMPPLMKPKKLNIIFSQYGDVGRMFFQQEDKNFTKQRKKKGGNRSRAYTEGWIEFKKKKIAKRVALTFNNTRIGVKKRSRYYDDLWNIKYLHRFQWAHLMERLEYEKQVRGQRVRTEVMQAKKETNFYLKNVEQQKVIDRMQTKKKKQGKHWEFKGRNFKQWRTEEEREEDRRMLQEAMPQRSGKVTSSVLGKIFKK